MGLAALVRRTHIAFLFVAIAAPLAHAADGGLQPNVSRVYPADAVARELIQDGSLRSPTIAKLAQTIFHSEWYVIVEARPCPGNPTLYGCLAHNVSPFLEGLALRLFVNPKRGPRNEMLATLGHELQHAVEVIQAGNIRTTNDMLALFTRVGTPTARRGAFGQSVYETDQAERTSTMVMKELRAADALAKRR